jgi:hypothetical protein
MGAMVHSSDESRSHPGDAAPAELHALWCTATMRGAFVDPGGDLDRLKAGGEVAEG